MTDQPIGQIAALRVEVPMSRGALLDWIGHAARNRAFPEFHAAPLPLWATDAAENILGFIESLGVVAVDPDTAEAARAEVERIVTPWREALERIAKEAHYDHALSDDVRFEYCGMPTCEQARALLERKS